MVGGRVGCAIVSLPVCWGGTRQASAHPLTGRGTLPIKRVLIVGVTLAALVAATAQTVAGPRGSTSAARNAALRQYGQPTPQRSASSACNVRAPFRLTLFRGGRV